VERSALNVERGTEQLLHARDYQVGTHTVIHIVDAFGRRQPVKPINLPLIFTWPSLRCVVCLEEAEY